MPDENNGTNGNSKRLEIQLTKLQTIVNESLIKQVEALLKGVKDLDVKFETKVEKLTENISNLGSDLKLLNHIVEEWEEQKKLAVKHKKQAEDANTKGKYAVITSTISAIGLIIVALITLLGGG